MDAVFKKRNYKDYIKTMTRKFSALSEGGKAKTGQTAG
jgi:hypothetical protein